MPKFDFTETPDRAEFEPVPEGEYLCVVSRVDEKETQAGDTMWGIGLEILEGEHKGRLIFDNLVFVASCKPRLKVVFHRFGFPVDEPFDASPSDLEGKRIYVTTEIEEYNGKDRNKVTFAGYRPVDAPELEGVGPDDDVPF